MHTRKHTVGRNILRFFEIAIFFAVSVLGYGLLLKASSLSTKSKARDHSPGIQRSVTLKGLHRELKLISGKLVFPKEPTASNSETGVIRPIVAYQPLDCIRRHVPSVLSSFSIPRFLYRDKSDRTPYPHNLLQQNPVLLV